MPASWSLLGHSLLSLHTTQGDLGAVSDCVGGALVLEEEKYVDVSFPLLQRRHSCLTRSGRKPPSLGSSAALEATFSNSLYSLCSKFLMLVHRFIGSRSGKQDTRLTLLVPTHCSGCIQAGFREEAQKWRRMVAFGQSPPMTCSPASPYVPFPTSSPTHPAGVY